MSEHAAGVKLLREQAQVLACTGVSSWRTTVPTSACMSKARELKRSTKRISATVPHTKEVCSSSVCIGNTLPKVLCAVSLLFQKSASVQVQKRDRVLQQENSAPFPRTPNQWWWYCEVLPRKHRTEPKIQLNWCPVALARIVIACRRTPSIHGTENSRNFPFLNKMIYSSLSYRKETMGKEDQVCQEQCIPFISVFSLTRKKCIIITERN